MQIYNDLRGNEPDTTEKDGLFDWWANVDFPPPPEWDDSFTEEWPELPEWDELPEWEEIPEWDAWNE